MSWKGDVGNLVKFGDLRPANYVEEDVRQYVDDAARFLRDAKLATSPGSRFLPAYEGLHTLSLAVLNKVEVRADSAEGQSADGAAGRAPDHRLSMA